uniref:GCV_T domain-containing protein n=1 Tax=Panagrellus redivivus TaxID=6233 RepID=A0A7E4VRN1_PANRE
MFIKIVLRSRLSLSAISISRGYASTAGWGRFTKPAKSVDGFYIDTRQGQRQVLKDWVSRNGHKYRFEVADDTDFDMATAFWAETFNKTSNIVEKLNPEEHELYPVLVPMAEFMIAQRNIIICFDEGGRLVGTGVEK